MIKFSDFFNGQSELGKLQQNKFEELTNIDIHTNVGMAQAQYKMENESTVPNEKCVSTTDNNGNIFFCSIVNGKIWKKTVAGSYSLVHTNGNGGHADCDFFNGYLWYWTASKLGYYDLSSTWDDNFATFANGNARGSVQANNTLCIGDGRYIARVDASNIFSANEFVIPGMFKITEMVNVGDNILIGTYVNEEVAYCKAFLWDTISASWMYEDEVFEIGINTFIQLDNFYIAQCGKNGNFYAWGNGRFNYFGKIKDITTDIAPIGSRSAVFKGRALYANNNKIYSIHRENTNFPFAFCGEYATTNTISSLQVQGQKLLASVNNGVDKKSDTTKASGTIITPEVQGSVARITIDYDEDPNDIGLSTKVQNGSWVSQTLINDDDGRYVYFNGGLETNAVFQAKITLTNNAKIKSINIE